MSTRILAIDTATEACSVALYDQGETLAHFELCAREHTQRILPLVQQILAEAGLSLKQLDALAFGRGPGSFTGVRIGIGIAQGLSLGAELPLLPVSTLLTMAQGAYRQTGAEQVLAAIDARMGEVYWGEFTRNTQGVWSGENTETVIKPEQLLARTVERNGRFATVGTGWEAYPHLLGESPAADLFDGKMLLPQAEDMLPLALQLWENGIRVNPEDAEPTYLRNEVTWKKLPGR
ncbi:MULTISPECIES: tRNA (adenosine(37)-N6)-threonylcarbamoyltransferase complex dimerization subunit type 1 TsaB [Rahnella]|jgi:tRNA threonylcarbamoyladenosine biosynthesis protein TsaB|uniref:tRNA (adenosine(37)-N6)-threonylcarbamoyltransferase complex dimerization subunit type 1 TsaB n=1 Tax=Rahnella TaxID=34037 RepID=UPI000256B978|nr:MULTISPECIES: tRNA (adenosine(37)-N6)-threonylcarbamoyltransferase complex dimerization subunit type 1 TsaB [Rahnella]AFE58268.1 peptidase M22 glycoprotease [Rahnella aquatilis HX2]AYA06924.1 tRNA (adenosine(37)-N6)-threonylcarbamoyltransferase complex dimerization subunit type 1 TsaB [Rahnella aquatilis]AZP50862.1 tRNA (adenosine(37)-N6)-threonylcarbamoyltransferase complex dimerization subunit type 1 TsaB [Rahnella aquatilis]MBU9840400.1 tRNA (adenosine(37)-N6)-threonylcarbamoyltransferase